MRRQTLDIILKRPEHGLWRLYKSNHLIFESNWTFVPNVKTFPQGVLEISCSQEQYNRNIKISKQLKSTNPFAYSRIPLYIKYITSSKLCFIVWSSWTWDQLITVKMPVFLCQFFAHGCAGGAELLRAKLWNLIRSYFAWCFGPRRRICSVQSQNITEHDYTLWYSTPKRRWCHHRSC